MNIKVDKVEELVSKINGLKKKLEKHPLHNDVKKMELCEEYAEKFKVNYFFLEECKNFSSVVISYSLQLSEEIENTISEFKKLNKIDQLSELKKHKKVLRKLNYCSATEVVDMKGRIACELSR